MSFYSGRAGRSFAIEKIFPNIDEMNKEASLDLSEASVPINGFVLVVPEGGLSEGNAAVYVKQSAVINEIDTYKYLQVGTIAGIFPDIENGYWVLGGKQTNNLAVASQVQFRIYQEEAPAEYVFVSRLAIDETTYEYGLCDLDERYIWNESLVEYELSAEGTFVKVIKANVNGTPILDENGVKQYYQDEEGNDIYFDINGDTWGFNINLRMNFVNTWVQ